MNKEHKIGLLAAIIISMNGMIGAGIFTVPTKLIAQAGPAGLLTYLFVSIAVWLIALTLSRTAQLYPEEGSFYRYTRQWGGHTMGIIAAGSYIIGLVIALGLLSGIAGSYVHSYIPAIPAPILSYAIIIMITLMSITGLRMTKWGQYALVLCTVIPILITTAVCFSHARLENITPFMPFGFFNVFAASKAVIFGFFGFECATSLFTIIKDPEKNVPKALTYSLLVVSFLYMAFMGSLVLAIPRESFQTAAVLNLPLTAVLAPLFAKHLWILSCINFSITTAIIGVVYAMTFSCGQLLASLSKRLTRTHFHLSPQVATVYIALGTVMSFVTLHNADLFFSLTALFILTAFILSMLSLLGEKKYKVTTVLALITSLLIFACASQGLWVELNKKFILRHENSCLI